MTKHLQKLAKLYTKAQEVTSRDKAKKILKKAKKLQKKIHGNQALQEADAS